MPAYAAKGTSLTVGGVTVGRLTKIGGVGIERDELDSTAHDSSGGFKEFIMSFRDAGEVDLEYQFDPSDAGQEDLRDNAATGEAAVAFTIVFPTTVGYTWTFSAWVKSLKEGDSPFDGLLTSTATLRITGQPTLAATV